MDASTLLAASCSSFVVASGFFSGSSRTRAWTFSLRSGINPHVVKDVDLDIQRAYEAYTGNSHCTRTPNVRRERRTFAHIHGVPSDRLNGMVRARSIAV